MIKIENIEVSNFKSAFRGMRNPKESWKESDSKFGMATMDDMETYLQDIVELYFPYEEFQNLSCDKQDEIYDCFTGKINLRADEESEIVDYACIGPKDLKLAQSLILAGSDHGKFMRQIFISMDLTLPLYVWKEFDTYKVGTVANSCSTMHKLATTPITKECFSFDEEGHQILFDAYGEVGYYLMSLDDISIGGCEVLRKKYLETKDIKYWRALIQLLPESWNQKRTITLNYQVLRAIYFARKNHKLQEWSDFCHMIEGLPWGKELICLTKEDLATTDQKYFLFIAKE
jgi:hypothetical protein